MNRRGQIFLVITMVVLLYSMSIAFTLLSVQLEANRDTNPNAKSSLFRIDNIISEVHMASQVILGEFTRTPIAPNVAELRLQGLLQNIENTFNEQGFFLLLEETAFGIQRAVSTDQSPEANITFSLSIKYESAGRNVSISTQILVGMRIQFNAPTTPSQAFVTLILSNQVLPVPYADTTGSDATAISLGNGVYDISAFATGQNFQAISPTGISVTATVP